MTDSDLRTEPTVRTYYEILTSGIGAFDRERLSAILAPDLMFEGPIAGQVVGSERFVKGVSGFVETLRCLHMVHQLYAEDMAAVLYDAEMPGGMVRFAEFLRIEDGKIHSLRLLYDPSEYRSRGGR